MAEHRNPVPTVDILIVMGGVGGGRIVLIERKNPPLGWALPGGFVDVGETLAAAARREAKEETDLDVELVELFHCYSDPRRDPRLHTCSTVFIARAPEGAVPRAGDDAGRLALYGLEALPPLAFDHATILSDYRAYRETGRRPPPER
jgi:ADP-ribose pyrophosphatase YjhB (NUDIX family)